MKGLLGVMVALVAFGLVFLPMNAQAGEKFGMKKQIEVGGSIAFSSTTPVQAGQTGDATTDFAIEPYVGYFIIDGFELGLIPMIDIQSPPGGGSSTTLMNIFLAPAWTFQLQNSMVTPFIEALVGFTSQSSGGNSASGFSWGGRAGAKFMVTGNGLLNFDVRYLMLTANPSGSSERNGQNLLQVGLGFTVFFN